MTLVIAAFWLGVSYSPKRSSSSVMFISEVKMEHEMDRQISAASAATWMMY